MGIYDGTIEGNAEISEMMECDQEMTVLAVWDGHRGKRFER